MGAGDIVYARFPITIDSSAAADGAITTALANFFPIATYTLIHTELVFDTGSKTKATVVVIAQAIT